MNELLNIFTPQKLMFTEQNVNLILEGFSFCIKIVCDDNILYLTINLGVIVFILYIMKAINLNKFLIYNNKNNYAKSK